MKRVLCCGCGAMLGNTDIALTLKLCGRASSRFFCRRCMALRCDMSVEQLGEMAEFYRSNGCELFSREYVKEKEREGA